MNESDATPLAARLLETAIRTLRTDVLPLLADDAARIRIDHITRLMRAAIACSSRRRAGLERLVDDARRCGLPVPPLHGEPTLEKLEAQRAAIESSISGRLPALLDAAANGDADALAQLEAIVACQKAFFVSQDPDILRGSQVAYRGGRIDDEPAPTTTHAPVDAPALTAYLQRRFARTDLRAEDVRPIPGGFSKETVLFTLVDQRDGSRQALVMRKDVPVPFVDKTVVDEFPTLQALHARGFAVARPVLVEPDPAALGSPFLVSARVPGTSNAATWMADPVRAAKACRELARLLAELHRYTPAELGFPAARASLSAGASLEREIDHWIRLYHERKRVPVPTQEIPLVWLRRNIPKALYERPARVVHGDVGFHNLMFDDAGEVTALLDWEFSILGEATQDLCFVRLFVEPLMPWPEFLALYRGFGGPAPCTEAEFFFDLWTKARNSTGCVVSQGLFDSRLATDVRFALAGHVFGPYLYIEECEAVLGQLRQARPANAR